jgi:hypothetical protein
MPGAAEEISESKKGTVKKLLIIIYNMAELSMTVSLQVNFEEVI